MQNKIIKKDLGKGIIEVEGSEEFVSKQLDEFFNKTKTTDKDCYEQGSA